MVLNVRLLCWERKWRFVIKFTSTSGFQTAWFWSRFFFFLIQMFDCSSLVGSKISLMGNRGAVNHKQILLLVSILFLYFFHCNLHSRTIIVFIRIQIYQWWLKKGDWRNQSEISFLTWIIIHIYFSYIISFLILIIYMG